MAVRGFVILGIFILFASAASNAQTTAVTYQGSLNVSGSPANGNYDFSFALYSVASGGLPILPSQSVNNVAVVNGSFSVRLNFSQSQVPGADRFLEISVRPAGQGTHTLLTPRQQLTSSPYSIKSLNAGNAEMLGGIAANQYVVTSDSRLTDARNPLPNSGNYIQNRTTPQAASNFSISGNGTIGGILTARENSFFEKGLSLGTTLDVGGAVTVGTTLNVGSTATLGSLSVGSTASLGSLSVGSTATVGSLGVGSTASVGSLTVGSTANVSGTINTSSHYRIGGNQVLTRSRLDLFNTAVAPRGYSFEVLNSPSYLVLKNDQDMTIMTVAADGKVGIGDNNPIEATLEVGGTLAVSNLGGSNGDHLCRDGNLIRACSAAAARSSDHPESSAAKIEELESTVQRQQAEIDRQRNELAALKSFICSQNLTAALCGPRR